MPKRSRPIPVYGLLALAMGVILPLVPIAGGYAAGVHIPSTQAEKAWSAGFTLYKSHNYLRAIGEFDRAIALDPACYRAWNGKGVCLAFLGQAKQGLVLIDKALALNPKYENGFFNRGLALELAGQYSQAVVAYAHALEIEPRNPWSYYGQACAYGRMGKAIEAAACLKQAIAIDPSIRASARREADLAAVRSSPSIAVVLK